MDPSAYCREIEAYLCRKNEGHLIRIVGPAFEQVCGWAMRGIPLNIAFRGIDQYCERYYRKGPKRRPVRIEFCEADILGLFDDWRRAVGVSNPAEPGHEKTAGDAGAAAAARKPPLAAHVERAIARLTALRAGGMRSRGFDGALASAVRELDRAGAAATSARGQQRERLIARLEALDRALMDAARAEIDPHLTSRLRRDAEAELAPFGARMAPEARARSVDAAFERLVREHLGLPFIVYI